jgi:hypothetical protein
MHLDYARPTQEQNTFSILGELLKERTGANPGNTRDVTQQYWSNLEISDRCHVTAYKKSKN